MDCLDVKNMKLKKKYSVLWLDHLLKKAISHLTKRVLLLKSTEFSGLVDSIVSGLNIHTQ